jgi:hypothetical protein
MRVLGVFGVLAVGCGVETGSEAPGAGGSAADVTTPPQEKAAVEKLLVATDLVSALPSDRTELTEDKLPRAVRMLVRAKKFAFNTVRAYSANLQVPDSNRADFIFVVAKGDEFEKRWAFNQKGTPLSTASWEADDGVSLDGDIFEDIKQLLDTAPAGKFQAMSSEPKVLAGTAAMLTRVSQRVLKKTPEGDRDLLLRTKWQYSPLFQSIQNEHGVTIYIVTAGLIKQAFMDDGTLVASRLLTRAGDWDHLTTYEGHLLSGKALTGKVKVTVYSAGVALWGGDVDINGIDYGITFDNQIPGGEAIYVQTDTGSDLQFDGEPGETRKLVSDILGPAESADEIETYYNFDHPKKGINVRYVPENERGVVAPGAGGAEPPPALSKAHKQAVQSKAKTRAKKGRAIKRGAPRKR